MKLFEKPQGVRSHWVSFEGPSLGRGQAGLENKGSKGHPFERFKAGETKTLLDVKGSGTVTRIWVTISDRSPEMLRSLRIDMFWDDADRPAVSVPFGDFFGIGLGRRVAFECALFSDPEGRSFNCFIPMPFRTAARITVTNESEHDLTHLFYDVDLLHGIEHSPEALYFHAHWRRESPNRLGEEFLILPRVKGAGRFLGCNLGIITDPRYENTWWGEGEVKIRLGDDADPTLCGTGTEDYIGTGWGQGFFAQRTQGCPIADKTNRHWAFYRYHVDDPVFFDDGCQVSIQTMGGAPVEKAAEFARNQVPIVPISVDLPDGGPFYRLLDLPTFDLAAPEFKGGWCNLWRQDDWSGVAYFYLDSPEGRFHHLPHAKERAAGLKAIDSSG